MPYVRLQAYAINFLRSFRRGTVEVEIGDWIMVSSNGVHLLGQVAEMAQLFMPGGFVVRLLLGSDWEVNPEEARTVGNGMIRIVANRPCFSVEGSVIALEMCEIEETHVELLETERGMEYVFTYTPF